MRETVRQSLSGRTIFVGRREWRMVKTDEGQLSQPSGSDWKGKPNPAKQFKAEAETRNACRTDEKDRVEMSVSLKGFFFKGEGDWLDKFGGKMFLAMIAISLVALAWMIREWVK